MQDLVPLLSPKTNISNLKSGSVDSSGLPGLSEKLSDGSSSLSFHEVLVDQRSAEGLETGFETLDLTNSKLQDLSSTLKNILNDPEALTGLSSGSPLFEQLQSLLQGNDFSDLFSGQGGSLPPSLESIQQSMGEILAKLSASISKELPDSATNIDVLEQVRSLLLSSQGALDLIQGKNNFIQVADVQVAQLLGAKPVPSTIPSNTTTNTNTNAKNAVSAPVSAYLAAGEQAVVNSSQAAKDSNNLDIPKQAIA